MPFGHSLDKIDLTPYTQAMEILAVVVLLAGLGIVAATFGYDSRDWRATFPR